MHVYIQLNDTSVYDTTRKYDDVNISVDSITIAD